MPEFTCVECGKVAVNWFMTSNGDKLCGYCGARQTASAIPSLKHRIAGLEERIAELEKQQQRQHEYDVEMKLYADNIKTQRMAAMMSGSLSMYPSKELLAELQRRQDGGA